MISRIKTVIATSLLVLMFSPPAFSEVNVSTSTQVNGIDNGQAHYTKGLTAYINNDYVLAQQYWLKAAELSNAKAMFNLGLLHQEKLISAASAKKAANWFLLAGKHGYSAGYYHYATILRDNGEIADAETLIKQAADQGYQPALQQSFGDSSVYLSNNSSVNSQANDTVIEASSNDNAKANSNVKSKSNGKDNNKNSVDVNDSIGWIKSQAPDNWTIQLIAYPERVKIEAFIKQHDLTQAVYFYDKSGSKSLYKLIYGSYLSKEKADKARQSLSKDLLAQGPWLRTLQSVQNSIK